MIIHKKNTRARSPSVSIILLDWSVREHFQALDWLPKQTVPRDQYELIWIELFHRVVPQAMECADVVITLEQRGLYHKHKGYNVGVLQARGELVTICDSDGIYPPNFVESLLTSFKMTEGCAPIPLVLMHYQWRTLSAYPESLTDLSDLAQYRWLDLWPNVGACMTVRTIDAINFGGFDEHRLYRGYLCGPYELGWRLINAGILEVWHDTSVALWHFAHPNPNAGFAQRFSFRLWREMLRGHVNYHALTAVEAFSTGRLQPIVENPGIHERRMNSRRIATRYEEYYSTLTNRKGFTFRQRICYGLAALEPLLRTRLMQKLHHIYLRIHEGVIRILFLKGGAIGGKIAIAISNHGSPEVVEGDYKNFSIVLYRQRLYAFAIVVGPVDPGDNKRVVELQNRRQCAVADSFTAIVRCIEQLSAAKQNHNE